MWRAKVTSEPDWDEAEYAKYLRVARHMFAWCLSNYGGIDETDAAARAEKRYPFEPPGKKFRGIIFHDSSWHYAMIEIHGPSYWTANRELERAPDAYQAELDRAWAAS